MKTIYNNAVAAVFCMLVLAYLVLAIWMLIDHTLLFFAAAALGISATILAIKTSSIPDPAEQIALERYKRTKRRRIVRSALKKMPLKSTCMLKAQ